MAFHIVTSKCFLACENVTSVLFEELIPDVVVARKRRRKKGGKLTKPIEEVPNIELLRQFMITISFYPLSKSSTSSNSSYPSSNTTKDEGEVLLRVIGEKEARALYAEIIKEIQEQHPNEGYLDKLVNKMLESEEFQIVEPEIPNVTL